MTKHRTMLRLNKPVPAFTLLEMLLVLIVISVLMLLFIPNLSKQKAKITDTGNAAVVKVVENQAELYELTQGQKASLAALKKEGSLSDKQVQAYKDYYAKHNKQKASVPTN
ncbi:competence type IV pilus major pilin ComGC [Streptococcus halichoeri]|uniref:competence type IV pilus major pilin ComGC n=1 Tax=Streptococcus halichoeri TaxID=254785 RepID=UPI002E29A025|nr:competence type IV pilus major pilin ComGC [Streptococcus halichoeri]